MRLLKLYIPVAAVAVSITVVIALAVTLLSKDVYQSSMTLAVGTNDAVVSADLGAEAQPITNTVSQLLRTNVVAATVIKRLNLDESPETFLKDLKIEQKPDAAALDISYKAPTKSQAVAVLNELSGVYQEQVKSVTGNILGATGSAGSADRASQEIRVAVRVFDPPHALEKKVAPRPVRNLGVAIVLGLMLAAFWVALSEAARTRRTEAARPPAGHGKGAGLAPADRVEPLGDQPGDDVAADSPRRQRAR